MTFFQNCFTCRNIIGNSWSKNGSSSYNGTNGIRTTMLVDYILNTMCISSKLISSFD